jgi:hypothetical protein
MSGAEATKQGFTAARDRGNAGISFLNGCSDTAAVKFLLSFRFYFDRNTDEVARKHQRVALNAS